MPNKTLYIKDRDVELWEKAEKLAKTQGGSLSEMATEALKTHVEQVEERDATREELAGRMQEITLEVMRPSNTVINDTQKIRFTGALLVEDEVQEVYVTKSGTLIHRQDFHSGGAIYSEYETFDDFDALQEWENEQRAEERRHLGDQMMGDIADALGEEWVIEID